MSNREFLAQLRKPRPPAGAQLVGVLEYYGESPRDRMTGATRKLWETGYAPDATGLVWFRPGYTSALFVVILHATDSALRQWCYVV